jgi:phospholipase C
VATQLTTANQTWRSYQEGLDANTGACPVHSSGVYAPKHDPFVFFTDVAGNPPAADNAFCAAHHKPFSAFAADLTAGDVAQYTFITPNLCNDMHGDASCTNGCTSGTSAACISAGDAWLAAIVPAIIAYMTAHGGVLFIVWDEPENNTTQPFLVVGPHVKAGYASGVSVTHSSYVKSLDEIFGLPTLPKASAATDFSDYFEAGHFP